MEKNLETVYKDKYKSLVEYNVEILRRDVAEVSRRAKRIQDAFFNSCVNFSSTEKYIYDLFLLNRLVKEDMILLLDRKYSLGRNGDVIRTGYNFRVLGSVEKEKIKESNENDESSSDSRNIYCYFGVKNSDSDCYTGEEIVYGRFFPTKDELVLKYKGTSFSSNRNKVNDVERNIVNVLVNNIIRPYFGARLIPRADIKSGSSNSIEELKKKCKDLYDINKELCEKIDKLKSNKNNDNNIKKDIENSKVFNGKFRENDILTDEDIKEITKDLSKRSLYKFEPLIFTPAIIRYVKTLYFLKKMSIIDISIKVRVPENSVKEMIDVYSSKIDHKRMSYKGTDKTSFDPWQAREIYDFVVVKNNNPYEAREKFKCSYRTVKRSIEYIRQCSSNASVSERA